jgi:hypothetical protein
MQIFIDFLLVKELFSRYHMYDICEQDRRNVRPLQDPESAGRRSPSLGIVPCIDPLRGEIVPCADPARSIYSFCSQY